MIRSFSPASTRPKSAQAHLDRALAAHRKGKLDVADETYRSIPADSPQFADACYYRGILHFELGNATAAVNLMDRALTLRPDQPAWLNDRGIVAASMDQHDSAIGFLLRAIEHAPGFALAHCNLAKSLRVQGQLDTALWHFGRALELDGSLVDAALNRGGLLEAIARTDDAIACYRHALTVAADHPLALMLLGNALNQTRRHAEAAACFERLVHAEPDSVDALFGLAFAYDAQRDFDKALAIYRKALTLQPDSTSLHNNLAYTLTCLARYDEAEPHYRRAIELNPDLSEAHHQLSMIALRKGDYREGWIGFEHRKLSALGRQNYGPLPVPEWQGEALAGKHFLLAREQGAGDQIQFVRYASVLAKLGATVDVWTSPELANLLQRAPGIDRVITEAPGDGYDYGCRMMSVPRHLDDTTIPAAVPYLEADRALSNQWRQRLSDIAGKRKKIGVVWAGNPQHHLDAFRSIPLAQLEPLSHALDAEWFALQKGAAEQQIDDVSARWPIHTLAAELPDFDVTAAVIDALDLVITVDTSVAHLAGALGKPVWVLLPAQSDWRWMLSRDDSPWYPQARLFRQSALGDWSDVVASVGKALSVF